jgi:hypothetical protein
VSRAACGVLLVVIAGCAKPTGDRPPDTGSRDAARGFFEAVGRGESAAGYEFVHPESRAGCSTDEFGRRVGAYRRQLGFEATAVRVPACDERGDEATAHVVLSGRGKDRHEYKDTVMLRRHDGRWLVVLPAKFGQR